MHAYAKLGIYVPKYIKLKELNYNGHTKKKTDSSTYKIKGAQLYIYATYYKLMLSNLSLNSDIALIFERETKREKSIWIIMMCLRD